MEAELILLFNDGTADKRSLLYDTEEKICYVFSYSLTSSIQLNTALAAGINGLIYLENIRHDDLVRYLYISGTWLLL